MKAVLFGGGEAGRQACRKMGLAFPRALRALVWDPETGPPPPEAPLLIGAEESAGRADVLLCSGYGKLVGLDILRGFPLGGFNAHPSLLPAYRGRHAIQWAIAGGERELGVSVHRMSDRFDQGNVVLQARRIFGVEKAYPEISRVLAELAADLLVELCGLLEGPNPLPVVQNPGSGPSAYLRRRAPEDGRLDWDQGAARLLDTVRAGASAYPAYAFDSEGRRVNFTDYLAGGPAGRVLYASAEGCLINTAQGLLWLKPDRPLKVGELLQ